MEWTDSRLMINSSVDPFRTKQLQAEDVDTIWKPDLMAWNMRGITIRKGIRQLVRVTITPEKNVVYVNG